MRVIIVGSGPGGLVMGHCLLRAGIEDFVILERRPNPIENSGAGLAFWPQTFRIMDQLGLLDDVLKLSVPMSRVVHLDERGRVISEGNEFEIAMQFHGHPFMMFLRRELIELLYNKLPGCETRVLPGKKVVSVQQDDSGVKVGCADGSQFEGDIVIGCDGLHSSIRRLAIEAAGQHPPMTIATEYKCLFGHGPRLDGLPPCDMTELHAKDLTFQILSTKDRCFWLFYHAKEKESAPGQRYSAEDAEALAAKYKDHPVSWGRKVSFGDIWETKNSANLYELQEGVAERWYEGRAVIVGDAAHKMTASIAMGCNNAIESAASLTNQLHALLQETPNPSSAQVQAAFSQYQKERQSRAKFSVDKSGDQCRRSCYQTWLGMLMQTRILPMFSDRFVVSNLFAPWVTGSIKLDFVAEKQPPQVTVPWKYA